MPGGIHSISPVLANTASDKFGVLKGQTVMVSQEVSPRRYIIWVAMHSAGDLSSPRCIHMDSEDWRIAAEETGNVLPRAVVEESEYHDGDLTFYKDREEYQSYLHAFSRHVFHGT